MVRLVLLRLLESYFRHRWLYLLPIALMIPLAVLFILSGTSEYYASGRMFVEKQSLLASLTSSTSEGSWWLTPAQITRGELEELLATQAFVRSAVQKTDLEAKMAGGPAMMDEAFDEFRSSLSMSPIGDKLIEIGALNEDPRLAQQIVVATMEAYVQWKINTDYQESVAAQNFFANLITPYQDELQRARDELRSYLEAYPDPVRGDRPVDEQMEIARLQAQLESAEQKVNETLKAEEDARLALTKAESVVRQTYQVIDTPQLPDRPSSGLRDRAVRGVIFPAVGLILGVVAIVLGALLDRTMRFPIDVRYSLELPVLAVVPTMLPDGKPAPAAQPQRNEARPEAEATASRTDLPPQVYAATQKAD